VFSDAGDTSPSTQELAKRDGSRNFDVKINGHVVNMRSKTYYSSGQLYSAARAGTQEVWADYKDNDARNFKVALPSKRDPSKKSYYVTEHILEVSRNYHT
jgi:hypothetical protein